MKIRFRRQTGAIVQPLKPRRKHTLFPILDQRLSQRCAMAKNPKSNDAAFEIA